MRTFVFLESLSRLKNISSYFFQISVRTHVTYGRLHPGSEELLPKGSYPPQIQASWPLVLDKVPDILESWHLKIDISEPSNILRKCIRNPNVLQGSNLEMVDRGVFDEVPDILETCNLKLGIPGHQLSVESVSGTQMSFKDPTWRWWTGVSLMRFLTS